MYILNCSGNCCVAV